MVTVRGQDNVQYVEGMAMSCRDHVRKRDICEVSEEETLESRCSM